MGASPRACAGWRTLALWAARDLLRRPGQSVLFALALALLTAVVATPLLLTRALAETTRALIAQGPSLVVRRVNAGGWRPLPAVQAVEFARRVPGVVRAHARIWGVVRSDRGPVTVVGISGDEASGVVDRAMAQWLGGLPSHGAVLGPALAAWPGGAPLALTGAKTMQFDVVGRLPRSSSMVAHDLVLVNVADARELLGLSVGQASDLAVEVFHQGEEQAILPELTAAFPWPVHIATRSDMQGSYAAALARRGSLALFTLVPALVALVLLALAAWRDGLVRKRELGLLKALGWTTADLLRWRALGAVLVGLPAMFVGFAAAYQLVFWPGATLLSELLLGWSGSGTYLTLQPAGGALVLLQVVVSIALPWLAAALWPVARAATAQPEHLLAEHGR